ncbi:MAG: HAMP domain-containing histidine kinase [Deltaproteobacteria bacterium]|nr:HAMP domain-containing histidine kinase [Deltaproteobacteria bacterium]
MRLTWKLTAALLLGILLSLGGYAYLGARREIDQWSHDMRRDALVVGRALRASVAQAFAAGDRAQALAIVRDANDARSSMQVRWLEPGSDELDAAATRALAAGHEVTREAGTPRALYTWVPVASGAGAGAIEVREPLGERQAYVHTSVLRAVLATLALTALCGVIAIAVGGVVVGRRVNRLVAKAREVGRGELATPLPALGSDELGTLAVEMNAMSERLAAARERVAAETEARVAAMEQLRHADRLATVGNLAAGVAHELGTPLGVVAGRAEMIELGEVEADAARQSARIIREQSERMTRIIRHLLDFARRRPPEKAPQELGALVRDTVGILQPMAHKRKVHVVVEAAAPVWATVDAGQLVQAITNLTVNAVQASQGSEVTVTVQQVRARAPADTGVGAGGGERDWACVRVRDRGPGMSREVLLRVFEPFFTTKGVGEGTGLGLPVSEGIVREHGGFLAVDSEPGVGSVFSIHLPLLELQGDGQDPDRR